MAEVVYYVAASVDGYIATPDGAVDWLAPFHTAGEDHGYASFLATLGGIVMGRRSYDQVRGFGPWPYTGLDCRVVTSRPLPDTPDRVAPVTSPAEAVAGWADRRVWLVGGTTLLDGFRAARLVREYHVFVMPVLLGAGVPLFRTGPAASLQLVRVGCLPSGVVEVLYRVADAEPSDSMDSRASSQLTASPWLRAIDLYRYAAEVEMPEVVGTTFVLAVRDLDLSARFYVDRLGFAEDMRVDGWAFLSRGACRLRLGHCPEAVPMSATPVGKR